MPNSPLELSLQRGVIWLKQMNNDEATYLAEDIETALTLLELREAYIDYLREKKK